ncbi:amidohydrolase [Lysinibacillus sp. FSL W8-0992]|uniref:amidohydrolase n=1 Tax=Lysinibacillus sp. FSL W8-0992 TaxID=2954643 RepID=UPI0030FB7578
MTSTLNVAKEIEQVVPQILQWRRYLHENPELSYEEYATADFVYNQLISFGNLVVTRPTKTSVLAVLKGNLPGNCLALRADMDALPIQEETDLPFASKVAGVMHACGHDGHTAMLLGTAKILSTLKQSLKGEIRFIFQHAEELFPGGAKEMVAAGVVDGADHVIGLHLFSTLPTGKIGICAGPFTANSDTFDLEIIGKGGHSSQPQDSINPILIGSQITNVLHQIIPQKIDAQELAVLAVTEFHAGSAKNIIPDRLVIGGSVRTFSQQVREGIAQQIEMLVQHTVAAHGADYNLTYHNGYSSVINDEQLTAVVEEVIQQHFTPETILHIGPFMGGEDFSAFLTKVPGVFIAIGAAFDDDTLNYPHHHPRFAVNEDSLAIGLKLFVHTALTLNS